MDELSTYRWMSTKCGKKTHLMEPHDPTYPGDIVINTEFLCGTEVWTPHLRPDHEEKARCKKCLSKSELSVQLSEVSE